MRDIAAFSEQGVPKVLDLWAGRDVDMVAENRGQKFGLGEWVRDKSITDKITSNSFPMHVYSLLVFPVCSRTLCENMFAN